MDKQRLPLLIGLAIPVVLVVVLAGIIFLPRLYVQPQYDFLYATGSYPVYIDTNTDTRTEYRVLNGQLTSTTTNYQEDRAPYATNDAPTFYRYDVSEHQNIPLTSDDLPTLRLDPSGQSPDGFELTYRRDNDTIFDAVFGGKDYTQPILAKGSVSIPLHTVSTATSSYRLSDRDVIGWILPSSTP